LVKQHFETKGLLVADEQKLSKVVEMVKERCTLIPDFFDQAGFFFNAPQQWDLESVKPKWDDQKVQFFNEFIIRLNNIANWESGEPEVIFKSLSAEMNIKPGELQMILRVMLVGSKIGPAVFMIAETIGREDTISRIKKANEIFG